MTKKILFLLLLAFFITITVIGSIASAAIETLIPSGAGSETAIPSVTGAATHWQAVVSNDGSTSYVSTNTTTYTRDLYDIPAHSVGSGDIKSVKVCAYVYDNNNVTRYIKLSLRTNNTTYDGAEQTLSTNLGYILKSETWEENPNTSADWTWAQIDALQIGCNIKVGTAVNCRVTQVYVEVDYAAVVTPTVTTQAASSITATSATGNGNITATGGENATTRGFCYMLGTSGDPTTANSTAYDTGSFGTDAYTKSITGLSAATNYRVRAYAINSAGTGYGTTVQLLTCPAAPTNVAATDGTYTDKVTVTWTKSTGATGYRVYRDSVDVSGLLGDVATYDDTGAAAPTITPGTASATDGTSTSSVNLSLSGASANNGTTHTYKVVAVNSSGNSAYSATDTGYRGGVGALTYQWQRSAADSDATYSDITGATSSTYSDTAAPVYTVNAPTSVSASLLDASTIRITYSGASVTQGEGRYYKCVLNATGASQQTSTADRGYRDDTLASTDGYEIFSDTAAGGTYATSEGLSTASPFDDTGLSPDTTKYYKLKAKSTAGTWSSLSTAYGSATTFGTIINNAIINNAIINQ